MTLALSNTLKTRLEADMSSIREIPLTKNRMSLSEYPIRVSCLRQTCTLKLLCLFSFTITPSSHLMCGSAESLPLQLPLQDPMPLLSLLIEQSVPTITSISASKYQTWTKRSTLQWTTNSSNHKLTPTSSKTTPGNISQSAFIGTLWVPQRVAVCVSWQILKDLIVLSTAWHSMVLQLIPLIQCGLSPIAATFSIESASISMQWASMRCHQW